MGQSSIVRVFLSQATVDHFPQPNFGESRTQFYDLDKWVLRLVLSSIS